MLKAVAVSWKGGSPPAHTDKSIIQKMNAEIIRMLQTPDVRDKLATQGVESAGSTPAEVTAFMSTDIFHRFGLPIELPPIEHPPAER